MRARTILFGALLAVAGLSAPADARGTSRPASGRPSPAQVRPRAFASCADLVGYARRHVAVTQGMPEPAITPLGAPAATPGPSNQGAAQSPPANSAPAQGSSGTAGTGFSTTNNQEAGIDEPDMVKTDGSTIFTISGHTLYAVLAGAAPRLVGSLDLGVGGYGSQLLLRGSRLIVVSGGGSVPVGLAVARPGTPGRAGGAPSIAASPYYYYGLKTIVTEIDAHDPAAMKVTRTMSVDGSFVDARQNGGTARLVISSAPRAILDVRARTRAMAWIPARQFHSALTGRHYVRAVASCNAIRRPVQFSGLGMLTILTIDLDRGLYASDSKALMADAQVVYGSQNSLYVATQKWVDPRLAADRLPASQTTVIDRFDATDPRQTTLRSSGEVPGYLLNQFSMSEHRGYLRVATTSRPNWWGPATPPSTSQSYVTVLADQAGVLAPVGQLAGLGAGQRIYSVRFVDDAGYVVTFRQVDPLYTLDLSAPAHPRVAGQLELEGYSSYLHPLGDGLLLGVGQDIAPQGNEPSGSQLELFDVSRASTPRLLARTRLGSGSSSQVSYDHHAFLYWPPTKLAVLPVQIFSPPPGPPSPQPAGAPGAQPSGSGTTQQSGSSSTSPDSGQTFVGAIGFHVDGSGITELGRVSHDASNGYRPPVLRSLVIGERLFTISGSGVMASDLAHLSREGFLAFPSAAPGYADGGPPPAGGAAGKPAAAPARRSGAS